MKNFDNIKMHSMYVKIILSVFIVCRQQVVFTKDHTFCCLFQHVSATTSTQRGTVRKAQAAVNAA
jgi:hypothetical protein